MVLWTCLAGLVGLVGRMCFAAVEGFNCDLVEFGVADLTIIICGEVESDARAALANA